MGFVLHQGAVVLCMHGGQAQPTVPNPRVQVGGQPLLLQDSVAVCAPTGTGLQVVMTQVRVTAQ